MGNHVLFIGLDVDDNCFYGHGIHSGTGEIFDFACKPNLSSLEKKLKKLSEMNLEIRICYESTYLGFSLCRDLIGKGYACEVVASSLIPEISGKKVKTDRLDSEKLARYYMNGLLTPIHMPSKEEESVRGLCRTREFFMSQLKSAKLHILASCRTSGLNYKGAIGKKSASYWTKAHRAWLWSELKALKSESLKLDLEMQLLYVSQQEESIQRVDSEIRKISETGLYKEKVAALRSFRGIETLAAMTFITELGDVNRFSHPKQITSYVGMDLIEYSSGGKSRRYGLSKMGNRRLRTRAIEVCQTASHRPNISRPLRLRREGVDPKVVAVADRCMKRLYKRSHHLMKKGKHTNKAKVACARELYGFVWEVLKMVG